jgi:hypothetical protein
MYQSLAGSTKVAVDELDSEAAIYMMLEEVCRSVVGG